MIKLDTPIEFDIRGFLQWWFAELSALVPAWLRKMLTGSYDYLLATDDGDHFDLTLITEDPTKEFGRILLNEEGRQVWYRLVSRNQEMQNTPIVLRLLPGQALVKTITLPSAAESNLFQVIGFEMERFTPFKADQVYYDIRLIEKLSDLNQLKAELVLVPRKKLDAMLKRMVGLGLLPGRVDVATADEKGQNKPILQYNLLPQKLHDKPNQRKRLINGLLIFLLVVLITMTAVLPLLMKRNYMLQLEEQVKQEGGVANEVQSLKEDVDRSIIESDFLLKKKSTEPVMIEIVNELSTRLPDDTWLTHLNYRHPKLQVHGQSPSASALIEILEASPIFKNTSFVSPVNQDRNSGLERFQIATLVVQRKENDQRPE